jgi:hypothetical protein
MCATLHYDSASECGECYFVSSRAVRCANCVVQQECYPMQLGQVVRPRREIQTIEIHWVGSCDARGCCAGGLVILESMRGSYPGLSDRGQCRLAARCLDGVLVHTKRRIMPVGLNVAKDTTSGPCDCNVPKQLQCCRQIECETREPT